MDDDMESLVENAVTLIVDLANGWAVRELHMSPDEWLEKAEKLLRERRAA